MHEQKHGENAASLIVVDDEPAVLAALNFALELEGFAVATYGSGSELLVQSEFPQIACLIIDYRLPDMDGLDLLAALRSRGVHLPAVLITSRPPSTLCRRAAAANVQIVEKPLLGPALLDAIHVALAGKESARLV